MEGWAFWLAAVVAVALALLLAVAGFALVGVFLGGVIVVPTYKALSPAERDRVNVRLQENCSRLPFCDCGSGRIEVVKRLDVRPPTLAQCRPMGLDPATEKHVGDVIASLQDEFSAQLTPEDVELAAKETLAAFTDAPVVEFVPVLVYRYTRERLLAVVPA